MIKFTKMHGLGNDFMVIDGVNQSISLLPQQIASLSQPHTGVGFDQCLLLEPSTKAGIDFNYRIFNADGHEVGQCGNGARCLALFAKHYGLTHKNNLTVATSTTQMTLIINEDNTVSVNFGVPQLEPNHIPFKAKSQSERYLVQLEKEMVELHAINVGNPHAVIIVPDVTAALVNELGPQISFHPDFPAQTNVGFMELVGRDEVRLRVYERGCGETLACGSGAVAAAAIARLFYKGSEKIIVHLTGGDLIIDWLNLNGPIMMTGPAQFVYEGTLMAPV